jgi:hypothetical protein
MLKIEKPTFVNRVEEYECLAWSVYQFSNAARELVFAARRKNQKARDNRIKINSIRRPFWLKSRILYSSALSAEALWSAGFSSISIMEPKLKKNKTLAGVVSHEKGKRTRGF